MPSYSELVQGVLQEVNDLRRNPQFFLPRLRTFLGQYRGLLRYRPDEAPVLTQEGSAAVLQTIEALQKEREVRTCVWSEALGSAAQAQCNDLSEQGFAAQALQCKIERCGQWTGKLVEMVDYGSLSAVEVVCSLLVDDGVPNREHRVSLLSPELRFIGIGCSPHRDHRTITTILMLSKYTTNTDFVRCFPSTAIIPTNWQAQGWPEGAVKLTCETATETQEGQIQKRVIRTWAMTDGSTKVAETSSFR